MKKPYSSFFISITIPLQIPTISIFEYSLDETWFPSSLLLVYFLFSSYHNNHIQKCLDYEITTANRFYPDFVSRFPLHNQ